MAAAYRITVGAEMTKLGKKFTCWKCSTKFYDLNKPSAKCPKCGSDPAADPNRGAPVAAAPAFGTDAIEEPDEDLPEEPGEEEEIEDEHLEDDGGGGDEEF